MPPVSDIVYSIDEFGLFQRRVGINNFQSIRAPQMRVLGASFGAVVPPPPGETLVMTVGRFPPEPDPVDQVGFFSGLYGALNPAILNGANVLALANEIDTPPEALTLVIEGNLGQSFFTSMELNGVVYTSVSAGFQFDGTFSSWQWGANAGLIVGLNYDVDFVLP